MSPHPRLPGNIAHEVADRSAAWPVLTTRPVHADGYLSVRVDTIEDSAGQSHDRTVVVAHDAVAVVALDEDDRVLLVDQYRHAVGRRLFEVPAGILDIAGESAQHAAARELAEEADVSASLWEELLTVDSNPGYATGRWTIFVASQLSPLAACDRTSRVAEEAEMGQWWVPFDDAVAAVLGGRIANALTVAALLAVEARRRQ